MWTVIYGSKSGSFTNTRARDLMVLANSALQAGNTAEAEALKDRAIDLEVMERHTAIMGSKRNG